MKIDVKYVVIALIIGLSIIGVSADPQILTYYSGYWFNDRMEEVNPVIIQSYNEISTNPWVIEVIEPKLHYQNFYVAGAEYANGETIVLQKGTDTLTIVADVTTTLTITP